MKQTSLAVGVCICLWAVCSPVDGRAAPPFPIVDTGQTKCYGTGNPVKLRSCPSAGEEFYGQDGNYVFRSPAYQDNGDGTISDLVTGLMWQKGFTRDVAWGDAAGLAGKADTGGHRDWRVPTIKELYSLMNFQGSTGHVRGFSQVPSDAEPYLETRFFDFEYPTQSGSSSRSTRFIDAQYISSTAYTGLTMGGNRTFFGVNFADGRVKGYPQRGRANGGGWYLRLVRGNPDYGRNAFHDNGNGTVSDRATGLAWMQADSGDDGLRGALGRPHYTDGRMDWPEALRFCEGLDFAGAADWRLPDAKELQSLVDYARSPQGTRSAAIDPLFHATPITNEAGKPDFPGYWSSTTHLDGREPGTDAVVVYFGEALGTLSGGGGGRGGPGAMDGPPQGPMGGPGGGIMGPPPRFRGGPPPGSMAGRPQGPMGGVSQEGRRGQHGQGLGQGILDVHGAGAQRSDPKVGDPDVFPISGQGPQGDVRRVYNHVRCVRTAG